MALGAGLVSAVPITYTFTGSGTGTLGTQSFGSTAFTVTLTSDTTNVGFIPSLGATGIVGLAGKINIAGVGVESFTGTVFIYTFANSVGFGEANSGYPGVPGNLIQITDPSVDLYDLISNFTVTGANQDLNQFSGAVTSGGPLSFSIMSPVEFQSVQGTLLPEPNAGWVLLAVSGAAGFVAWRRTSRVLFRS